MATKIVLDPVTRIEGHLKIEVELDSNNKVSNAKSTGNMYRDFENILVDRPPIDAATITQRICGVCPVSHAIASVKAVENTIGFSPSKEALMMRNLILGANYISNNILHFYHLTAVDYLKGPQMSPWTSGYEQDLRLSDSQTKTLLDNYIIALSMRRKAQEMGAILGGKLPHIATVIPGGVTTKLSSGDINDFKSYLSELNSFITSTYKNDVLLLGDVYSDYYKIGKGYGNFLTYGVFDIDESGRKLYPEGVYTDSEYSNFSEPNIVEDVKYSWYSSPSNLKPADGSTTPSFGKQDAYSWLKSPRYSGKPHEAGALARAWISGDYRKGISVMDRHVARYMETEKIGSNMKVWIDQLSTNSSPYTSVSIPNSASGFGLTEAPRGALGHWISLSNSKISKYQIITPTCWNASPKDDNGNVGPIEKSLIGTVIQNIKQPVELLRIVHSFDPCTSCSVHVISPEGQKMTEFIVQPF